VTQLPPDKNSNISDHIEQPGSEKLQILIVTFLVGRKNQLLLINQPSGETTSELLPATDSPLENGTKYLPANSPTKLSDRRGSNLIPTVQNTKLEKRQ
jgi:hypothetical protein